MATSKKQYTVQTIFSAVDRMSRPLTRMTKNMDEMQEKFYYADRYMTDIFTKTTIALSGLAAAFGYGTKTAAWFETAIVKMATKLDGSTLKANKLIKSIQNLAIKSPLTAKPLIESADTLLAYGVKYENVLNTLKKLGDLSQGSDDVLAGMARGYGRILSEDRVTREHLDRFVFKGGVGIYKAMADTMGISHKEFSKLVEQGKIDSSVMIDAVNSLTSKGGMYYRAMENQMNTMNGLLAQFSEKFTKIIQLLGGVVNPVSKFFLRGYNDYFDDIITKLENTFAFETKLVVDYGQNNYIYKDDYISNPREVQQWAFPKSDAMSGIMLSFYNLFEVISKNKPNIDAMISRLDDGSSLFYDFMDVLGYVVGAFKNFIGILQTLTKVLEIPILGNFIKFLLEIGIFLSPFIFALVKGVKHFSSIKTFFTSASFLFGKLKSSIFGKLSNLKWFGKLTSFFSKILPHGIKVLGKVLGIVGVIMGVFGLFFEHFKSWRDLTQSVSNAFDWLIEKFYLFRGGLDFLKDIIISFFTGDFKMLLFTVLGFIWDWIYKLVNSIMTIFDFVSFGYTRDSNDVIRDFFTGQSKIIQAIIDDLQSKKGFTNDNSLDLNINVKTHPSVIDNTSIDVFATNKNGKPFGKNIIINNNNWKQNFYPTEAQRTF